MKPLRTFAGMLAIMFFHTGFPDESIVEEHILFVGDTYFGETYQRKLKENVLETKGYEYSLGNFIPILSHADLVVTNLEAPVTTLTISPFENQKSYVHKADPVTIDILAKNNISIFALANNHTLDFGIDGLAQTLQHLEERNAIGFGAGATVEDSGRFLVQKLKSDVTLAVYSAFAYQENYDSKFDFYADPSRGGVARLDVETFPRQVAEIRSKYVNPFIVVFPHWGDNYEQTNSGQVEIAHKLIDAGADLIIGHGAHMMQRTEKFNDKWVIYNLGNFVFNSPGRYQSRNADPFSLIADLIIREDEKRLRLYPIFTDNRITGYRSRFVTQAEFENVSRKLQGERGTDEHGQFMEIELSGWSKGTK